ncbi:regulatory protein RecX [Abditibacteriota bacterium]|nr:regulatory protein RecX [Abditibacteriota bacterium]
MARTPFPGTISLVQAQQTVRRHFGPRVNVFIEGKFSFAISTEVAFKHGLHPGLKLDEATIDALLREDGETKALQTALTFLGHRARSEAEIRTRLLKDEWSEPVIVRVLEKLRDVHLVDDGNFAQSWVENRSRFRPRGGRLLQQELRQKGVGREDIEAALPDDTEEADNALLALQKTARKWQLPDEREAQRKAIEFLGRRGFGYGSAKAAWTRFREEDD